MIEMIDQAIQIIRPQKLIYNIFLYMSQSANKTQLTLKDAIKYSEQALQSGQAINLQLHQDGERLERITNKVDKINRNLVAAERNTKEITSFWYSLKGKVMRTFGLWNQNNQSKSKEAAQNQNGKKRENNEQGYEIHSNVDEIQEDMDILHNNLKLLNKKAKQTGKELDRQAPIIDNLNNEVDRANNRMNRVNGILRRQINS